VDDLVEWLRAQLDEDERIARAAGGTWWAPPDLVGQVHDSGGVNIEAKLRSFATHIAEHDPARVLREIDAKRRLVDEFAQVGSQPDTPDRRASPRWKGDFGYLQGLARAVHLLASAYADRPGYRDDWRP
jgi:hypothetical protein